MCQVDDGFDEVRSALLKCLLVELLIRVEVGIQPAAQVSVRVI